MPYSITQSHRLQNFLHMVLLFTGLTFLTGLLGWIIAGSEGVIWTVFLCLLLFWFSPRLSPRMVLRLYRRSPAASVHCGGTEPKGRPAANA